MVNWYGVQLLLMGDLETGDGAAYWHGGDPEVE